MKYKRKEINSVQAFKLGSCYSPIPKWLSKAIKRGDVTLEPHTGIYFVSWNKRKKRFYEGDYIVKLPEGPVIGVSAEKFHSLYIKQLDDFIPSQGRTPLWAREALDHKIIEHNPPWIIIHGGRYAHYYADHGAVKYEDYERIINGD